MGEQFCVSVMKPMEQDEIAEIVELPLEDVLDLHPFAPEDLRYLINDYLDAAYEAGFPDVRIIHGKGIGAQRDIVRSLASRHPHVAAITPAPEEAGGWGATIISFAKDRAKNSVEQQSPVS